MSDCANFWDADEISSHTEIMQNQEVISKTAVQEGLSKKKVLLLVHGYDSTGKVLMEDYHSVFNHLSGTQYDVIIGYLWPGEDFEAEYFEAKSNARHLAPTVRSHLEFLSSTASSVDVFAHSMGNLLLLEALNFQPQSQQKIIQNYYALAAAVDNESIEKQEKYFLATQNCDLFYVFYSKGDDVLKWLYAAAEWDKALGYEGAEHPERLSSNVKQINCSNFINNHDQYYTSRPLFDLIQRLRSFQTLSAREGR